MGGKIMQAFANLNQEGTFSPLSLVIPKIHRSKYNHIYMRCVREANRGGTQNSSR